MMATTHTGQRFADQGVTFGYENPALAGKINNPPAPPFNKGGRGGFETYFLGNS
jgi:hypothetical protein